MGPAGRADRTVCRAWRSAASGPALAIVAGSERTLASLVATADRSGWRIGAASMETADPLAMSRLLLGADVDAILAGAGDPPRRRGARRDPRAGGARRGGRRRVDRTLPVVLAGAMAEGLRVVRRRWPTDPARSSWARRRRPAASAAGGPLARPAARARAARRRPAAGARSGDPGPRRRARPADRDDRAGPRRERARLGDAVGRWPGRDGPPGRRGRGRGRPGRPR